MMNSLDSKTEQSFEKLVTHVFLLGARYELGSSLSESGLEVS